MYTYFLKIYQPLKENFRKYLIVNRSGRFFPDQGGLSGSQFIERRSTYLRTIGRKEKEPNQIALFYQSTLF